MKSTITKIKGKYIILKLTLLNNGDFFEFNGDLYIKTTQIIEDSTIKEPKAPICYNITKKCNSFLSLSTEVFICTSVDIKYILETK